MLIVDETDSASIQVLARTVAKAKRVAVVTGAGISCAAGIPDFRSSDGLFQSLKQQNPQAGLNSGKDLFSASLFQSEANTSLYYQMTAELFRLAQQASPTTFHRLLKVLDDQGKLFRVYTQNIDSLERKAGLTFGLGDREEAPSPRKRQKMDVTLSQTTCTSPEKSASHVPPEPSTPKRKKVQLPRCVPLHGSLETLTCSKCSHQEPMRNQEHLTELSAGRAVVCPLCLSTDQVRQTVGQRSRGVGAMKPSIVLYGDSSIDAADAVGRITAKDLLSTPRPDLLIIAGTSLKVPGTKRIVKELSKVINPALSNPSTDSETDSQEHVLKNAKVVFLNLELPANGTSKEFASMVDVFVQGDVQQFAAAVMVQEAELAKAAGDRLAKKEGQSAKERAATDREKRLKDELCLAASPTKVSVPKQPTKPVQRITLGKPVAVSKGLKRSAPKTIKPRWELVETEGWNKVGEVQILDGKRARKPARTFGLADFQVSVPAVRKSKQAATMSSQTVSEVVPKLETSDSMLRPDDQSSVVSTASSLGTSVSSTSTLGDESIGSSGRPSSDQVALSVSSRGIAAQFTSSKPFGVTQKYRSSDGTRAQ